MKLFEVTLVEKKVFVVGSETKEDVINMSNDEIINLFDSECVSDEIFIDSLGEAKPKIIIRSKKC